MTSNFRICLRSATDTPQSRTYRGRRGLADLPGSIVRCAETGRNARVVSGVAAPIGMHPSTAATASSDGYATVSLSVRTHSFGHRVLAAEFLDRKQSDIVRERGRGLETEGVDYITAGFASIRSRKVQAKE